MRTLWVSSADGLFFGVLGRTRALRGMGNVIEVVIVSTIARAEDSRMSTGGVGTRQER